MIFPFCNELFTERKTKLFTGFSLVNLNESLPNSDKGLKPFVGVSRLIPLTVFLPEATRVKTTMAKLANFLLTISIFLSICSVKT